NARSCLYAATRRAVRRFSCCPATARRLICQRLMPLLFCGRKHDAAKRHAPFLAALQIDRSGQFFVAVQRSARDTRDFFVVDDGLPILHYSDLSPHQRDVIRLPSPRFAWPFQGWIEETIDASHRMA